MTSEARAIHELLSRRGVGRRELFLTQREGKSLPGGLESVSGFCLEAGGHVYGFWLTWNDGAGRLDLAPFYRVDQPERRFGEEPELARARARLSTG
ncbi:MAG: hypothetical protein U0821_09160 [Chloroflexota bacterium]